MSELDLSAERAKRTRENKTLIMRGDEGEILDKFELVPEFPAEALDLGSEGKLAGAFRQLFQDPDEAEHFIKTYKPSVDDLFVVMRHAYGLGDSGERLASGG